MEEMYFTLQDFFLHSKSVTYVLMGVALVAMVAFWKFLDEERGGNS